jgi:hypothetical protein
MVDQESSSSYSAPLLARRAPASPRKLSFTPGDGTETPEQLQVHELAESIVASKKRRRPSSELKKFIGDHMGVGDSEEIEMLLRDNDDGPALFLDRASRLAHSHMSECLCLVSENRIYILNTHFALPDGERPIPIYAIEKISTSQERDNAIVIHLANFKTELLMTPYKTELIGILVARHRVLAQRDLEVTFTNVISFPVNDDTLFEVDFITAAEGVRMTVFCKAARGNPED